MAQKAGGMKRPAAHSGKRRVDQVFVFSNAANKNSLVDTALAAVRRGVLHPAQPSFKNFKRGSLPRETGRRHRLEPRVRGRGHGLGLCACPEPVGRLDSELD